MVQAAGDEACTRLYLRTLAKVSERLRHSHALKSAPRSIGSSYREALSPGSGSEPSLCAVIATAPSFRNGSKPIDGCERADVRFHPPIGHSRAASGLPKSAKRRRRSQRASHVDKRCMICVARLMRTNSPMMPIAAGWELDRAARVPSFPPANAQPQVRYSQRKPSPQRLR